ncbi:MAG: NTP transferase domain-containing protein [Ignavibacteria bacterium]|nr:NTP transferase domain-containing protein [Ignavibacteria bacterium]
MKNFTTNALLLAAGASLRMQQAKAFLPLNPIQNFLQKCVYEFEDFGCQQIVVIVNTETNQRIKDEVFSFSDKVVFSQSAARKRSIFVY